MIFFNFFKKTKTRVAHSSDFSVFFREASSREKKRVFRDVALKANEDQRRVIEAVSRSAV